MGENQLKVTMAGKLVGSIWIDSKEESYTFEYCDMWKENGFAISPHLILDKSARSGVVRRFLENLIPEGKGLQDIVEFARISKNNTFGIIKAIGYDTSGALMFGGGDNEEKALFRPISEDELSERIREIEEKSIAIWDNKQRLSLAGVQQKLPVIIKDGQIGLGDGSLSSTHIMKFQIKKHANIVVNELFCMKLAKMIDLNVAEVELYRFEEHPVLMVKRFDRVFHDNSVERLHVIDGCQMLDLPLAYKYERNFGSGRDVKEIRNGVSFSKLFQTAGRCEVPAKAKIEMLNWSMFNLIIGNSDAHGKNFSFFVDKRGMRPTPFYDMLCILAHNDVEHDAAMAYGDEFDLDLVLAYQLRTFADDIGINYKLVSQTLEKLCKIVLEIIENEIVDFKNLNDLEKVFIEKLKKVILNRAVRLKDSASEMYSITY